MRRRDTEGHHYLGEIFFKGMNIFEMQGLLINVQRNFSASIEAFDMEEAEEEFNLASAFTPEELHAKMLLSEKLNVPFYIITYPFGSDSFTIYDIKRIQEEAIIDSTTSYNFGEFIVWWKNLKGTNQTKPLNEAKDRIAKSKVDEILMKNGLAWGGNIDGFIISNRENTVLGILEKRLSTKAALSNYDPANYFKYRGGDYYTWMPLVTLSNQLNCPLFLLTLHKDNQEYFGLAIVESIDENLNYKGNPPNQNLFNDIPKAKRWMSQYMNFNLTAK